MRFYGLTTVLSPFQTTNLSQVELVNGVYGIKNPTFQEPSLPPPGMAKGKWDWIVDILIITIREMGLLIFLIITLSEVELFICLIITVSLSLISFGDICTWTGTDRVQSWIHGPRMVIKSWLIWKMIRSFSLYYRLWCAAKTDKCLCLVCSRELTCHVTLRFRETDKFSWLLCNMDVTGVTKTCKYSCLVRFRKFILLVVTSHRDRQVFMSSMW